MTLLLCLQPGVSPAGPVCHAWQFALAQSHRAGAEVGQTHLARHAHIDTPHRLTKLKQNLQNWKWVKCLAKPPFRTDIRIEKRHIKLCRKEREKVTVTDGVWSGGNDSCPLRNADNISLRRRYRERMLIWLDSGHLVIFKNVGWVKLSDGGVSNLVMMDCLRSSRKLSRMMLGLTAGWWGLDSRSDMTVWATWTPLSDCKAGEARSVTWVEAFIKELSCWLMLVTPHNFLFSFSSLFSLLKLKLLPLRPTDRPDRPLSCQNKQNKSKSFSPREILTLLCKLILRLPGVELQDLCDSKTRIKVNLWMFVI